MQVRAIALAGIRRPVTADVRFNRVPIHVASWAFVVDKTVLKHVLFPPEYLSFTLS
jgi:hypothetical protein